MNKEVTHEKKRSKYGKSRKAYIAWEDNDTSSNSSSHEDVKAHLCLIPGQNSEVSSMNYSTSFNSENYSSLLQAFLETHEEAKKIGFIQQPIERVRQLVGRQS